MVSWIPVTVLAAVGIYGIWRIWLLVRFDQDRRRLFGLFWLWVPVWLILHNFSPPWVSGGRLFIAAQWAVIIGMTLDFFYFFLLAAPDRAKAQYLSLFIGLLAVLAFRFHWVLFSQPWELTVPHHARSIVWTDEIWSPNRYYFMQPGSSLEVPEQNYDDPNYGTPVYAPADCTVVHLRDDGFLELDIAKDGETVRIALGPLLSVTGDVEPGKTVIANRPLGLLDRTPVDAAAPGLQLEWPAGERLVFKHIRAGRLWRFNWARTAIGRNDLIESTAADRFRLR